MTLLPPGRYSIDVELDGSLSKETLLDAAR
jgi:hypothetical protein